MSRAFARTAAAVLLLFSLSCKDNMSSNREMVGLLSDIAKSEFTNENPFSPEAQLVSYTSSLKRARSFYDSSSLEFSQSYALLQLGQEEKSIEVSEALLRQLSGRDVVQTLATKKNLAIAYLRLGERTNCINSHSGESCVFPIAGKGIHLNKSGSEKAIELYTSVLKGDPNDLESRWLLNIAYMTTGGYPQNVPPSLLIKGLDADTSGSVKPFIDAAINVGLNTKNMAGGSIVDDFNNDGYLDIITSSMGLDQGIHYCRNNKSGNFTDISDSSGLKALTGGLNIMQTDYNNDGLKDVFVLRGGWKGSFGKEPNSLLRNNGDGTFTDVTKESGLLSFYPTQTATWADFNNDGWLDVFIGNESSPSNLSPCEFYINNRNGTFTEMANESGCRFFAYVKGVTSGDYNNDGLVDIFISTLNGKKVLLKNEGVRNNVVHFSNVTKEAGLDKNLTRTFPTWFWDYDNDGWLDILVCGYQYGDQSLAWYAAAEALKMNIGSSGEVFLFHNNHDGTFEDVSKKAGLNKIAFAMGSNFGDIDNDGYLDIYLGTGNPLYQSLVPNKMFRNVQGHSFIDVTTSARVGNLQKGHGVSFADLDNDGDQDIYLDMGGAFVGDAYQNSLYINPGQNNNRWINISLEGTKSNRAAIGARIKVTFKENGVERSVYRDVNSGGSFGSNPLMQHVGIGEATAIESIEIRWPRDGSFQVFKNVPPNENIGIKEGKKSYTHTILQKVDFTSESAIGCSPF
jgi:hypothetical protein